MVGIGWVALASPFRLFFPLAGGYAVVTVALWLGLHAGGLGWPGTLPPVLWHGHEMVFGYAAAVLAGFLLTAVANWTGSAALRGGPLALLGCLWLVGRLACASTLPAPIVAALDLPFLPALIAVLAVPIPRTGNRRQWGLLAALAVLSGANLVIHLDAMGATVLDGHLMLVVAVDLLMIPIAVMGGRVIPAFTGNALRQRRDLGAPRVRPWVEWLAVPVVAAVALCDLSDASPLVTVAAGLGAALVHAVRLSGWRGGRTLDQPMLWVLHLGYGWLVLGLALKGLAAVTPGVPPLAAMHALTVGALGTLSIGLMTRVTRGHTGRPLVAGAAAVTAYALITAAAIIRVVGPIGWPDLAVAAVALSGGLWLAAFAAFLWDQAGMAARPRVDGRPG